MMEQFVTGIKNRIIKTTNFNTDKNDIDIINEVNYHMNKITYNTDSLIKILSNYSSKQININTFNQFLNIKLPLYLTHFIKKLNDINIPNAYSIGVNTYENLMKEKEYKNLRDSKQLIIMWKKTDKNMYKILSILTDEMSEIDMDQKIYYLADVGGNTISENEYYWELYNRTKKNELVEKNLLGTLHDKIIDLIN